MEYLGFKIELTKDYVKITKKSGIAFIYNIKAVENSIYYDPRIISPQELQIVCYYIAKEDKYFKFLERLQIYESFLQVYHSKSLIFYSMFEECINEAIVYYNNYLSDLDMTIIDLISLYYILDIGAYINKIDSEIFIITFC